MNEQLLTIWDKKNRHVTFTLSVTIRLNCTPSRRSNSWTVVWRLFAHWPSLSLAMSILPLFIWRVACSAGRSWCRIAGSCSSAGDGDWTDWAPWAEEDDEEDEEEVEGTVEGVEPKVAGAEFRLWEEEEEEEWPGLEAVGWSPDVVSVKTMSCFFVYYFVRINIVQQEDFQNAGQRRDLLVVALSCKASCL